MHTPLTFIPLEISTARLIIVSNGSFANTRDLGSQLGHIILLPDDTGRANELNYGSNRCKRIVRRVMAAEVHARVLGFDYIFIIQHLHEELLGRSIKVEAYTDSRTIINTVVKDGNTTDRRLKIDICALREFYECGELSKVG